LKPAGLSFEFANPVDENFLAKFVAASISDVVALSQCALSATGVVA
jgi:hypothetical protein